MIVEKATATSKYRGVCTHRPTEATLQALAEGKNYRCDRCRANHRAWSRKLREEVLRHYGGACFCCGESTYEFLGIDHIDGGGNQHRKKINVGNFCHWLKKNGFPPGYRVACHNCNFSMGHHGFCPHSQTKAVGQIAVGGAL